MTDAEQIEEIGARPQSLFQNGSSFFHLLKSGRKDDSSRGIDRYFGEARPSCREGSCCFAREMRTFNVKLPKSPG